MGSPNALLHNGIIPGSTTPPPSAIVWSNAVPYGRSWKGGYRSVTSTRA
jgi:hypothetical protein